MNELINLRTRDSKTYDTGGNNRELVVGGDVSHYHDGESWCNTDVDLGFSLIPPDLVAQGWTNYFQELEWRVLVDTNRGRIAILPDRNDDTKYVLFRAHPTNNIKINIEKLSRTAIRCWRVGPNEIYNFIINDRGIKPYVYLYNSNAVTNWTLGFKLNNLQRVGRKIMDGDKLIGNLPDSWLEDSSGVIRNVSESIVNDTTVLSWDKSNLNFPITVDPTLTIQSSSLDARLLESTPTTSYGTAPTSVLGVGAIAGSKNRMPISFDLSALPVKLIIVDSTLSLYLGTITGDHVTTARTYAVYNLTRTNWTEACTWNTYDGTNNWTTAGGDWQATPETQVIKNNNNAGYLSWGVSSHIQSWLNSGSTVHFFAKQVEEDTVNFNIAIRTREHPETTTRPKLQINYLLVTARSYKSISLKGRMKT